jgi:hypothetical protein
MWDRWMVIDDLMMIDDDRTSVYGLQKKLRGRSVRIRDTNFHFLREKIIMNGAFDIEKAKQ